MYDLRWMGITPAWAGKRIAGTQQKKTAMDHPRVGGEKPSCKPLNLPVLGSPPHGRGKVGAEIDRLHKARITPAWAGKRRSSRRSCSCRRDHPRMGGEKRPAFSMMDSVSGSPPHGRGKVLTNGLVHGIDGITPARRGKVDVLFWGLVDGRITPAQAGKRGSGLLFHRVWWDHPRVGGEKRVLSSLKKPE